MMLVLQHAKAAAEKGVQMLSSAEERLLCQYFIKKLLEFCNVFEPRVPRSAVVGIIIYISSWLCIAWCVFFS